MKALMLYLLLAAAATYALGNVLEKHVPDAVVTFDAVSGDCLKSTVGSCDDLPETYATRWSY